MKSSNQTINGVVFFLLEILIGILLLINPIGFTSSIIITTGAVLAVVGIINVIKYFRSDVIEGAAGQLLTKGMLSIAGGCFCIFKAGWFISVFPVIIVIYGIGILISGLSKVQLMADMIRMKNNKWFLAAISALISIVCAVVIFCNPNATTVFLWTFTGISLIVGAVMDAVTLFVRRQMEKKDEII